MHKAAAYIWLQGPEEAKAMLYKKGYRAPYWRAPEVLRGEPPSKASDVYAYGMLLYAVLYRREPFEKENKEACDTINTAVLIAELCLIEGDFIRAH